MGRVILPELLIALVLLLLCGMVLVGSGPAKWAAGLVITNRVRDSRRARAMTRAQKARKTARWEARTRYQRGYAVVDVVRVARWDGREVVVDTEDRLPVIIPEENVDEITRVGIASSLRAQNHNTRL